MTSDPTFDWLSVAACRDVSTELFFPASYEEAIPARAICDRCAARSACLDYAMAHPELTGVWGGTSDQERNLLRRAAM